MCVNGASSSTEHHQGEMHHSTQESRAYEARSRVSSSTTTRRAKSTNFTTNPPTKTESQDHQDTAHQRTRAKTQIGTLAERLEASRGSSLNTPPNKLHHQHLQRSFTRNQAALPVFRPLAACSAHLDGYSHHELTKRPACSVSAPVGTA